MPIQEIKWHDFELRVKAGDKQPSLRSGLFVPRDGDLIKYESGRNLGSLLLVDEET